MLKKLIAISLCVCMQASHSQTDADMKKIAQMAAIEAALAAKKASDLVKSIEKERQNGDPNFKEKTTIANAILNNMQVRQQIQTNVGLEIRACFSEIAAKMPMNNLIEIQKANDFQNSKFEVVHEQFRGSEPLKSLLFSSKYSDELRKTQAISLSRNSLETLKIALEMLNQESSKPIVMAWFREDFRPYINCNEIEIKEGTSLLDSLYVEARKKLNF